MQKRYRQKRLLAAIIAQLALVSTAQAELKLQTFQEKLDGAPVQIYIVSDDGNGAGVEWVSAPLEKSYPAAGQALPELSSRLGLGVAVNANFYREDKPGEQDPIGLTIHEGRVLSTPNSYYPSVGVINGKLEWDNVRLQGEVEVVANGKTHREKICRFNGRATSGCASLWLGKIPAGLKNTVFITADGSGPAIGRKSYPLQSDASHAWALQWPNGAIASGATTVAITLKLRGERLGDKWEMANEAVSGSHMLSTKKTFPSLARSWAMARQPRTLTGVDGDGHPFVAVFDGRRDTSRGVSIRGAWEFLKKRIKAQWALNLDGGGSTTLLHDGRLVNKPTDGYPRAIAIGWGARTRAITTEPEASPKAE